MSWQKDLLEKYGTQLKLELRPDLDDQILVVLPKIPGPEIVHDIRALVPYKVKFLEGVKLGTLNKIGYLFALAGCEVQDNAIKRHLSITVTAMKGEFEEQALWDAVSKEILDDGYYESWTFEFKGEAIRRDRTMVVALAGHKASGVGLDDMDLKIALEVSQDVNDFLAMLEGKKFSTRKRKG